MPPTIEARQNSIETNHRRQVEHLSADDVSWLRSLGAELNETDIPAFRELVRLGSHDLREDTDPDTISSVMNARERFYGQILGWDDESNPLHESYQTLKDAQPSLMPIATFVQTQRVISELGLDATKVINTLPAATGLAPESVRQKFDNLTELGLDAARIINAMPATISLAPESVRQKFDNLTELGLDAARIINAMPATISLAPESVRQKFDNLTELGLDAVKVINAMPSAISLAPESVRQKFDNLTELGLDAVKVINAMPTAIGYASESVSIKIHALRQAGYISHKQPFPYDKPNVISSIFILPLESTLVYLASTKQPNNPDALAELPNLARRHMRQQGANNGPERKEHLIDNYETVAKRLGTAALRWASHNRLLPEPEGRKLLSLIDNQVASGSTA